MLIRGSKYEFRLSKWSKLALLGAFRAIQNPKNLFLESKNNFNQSPPTFPRGQAAMRSAEGAKCLSGGQNTNSGSQNGENGLFETLRSATYNKKTYLISSEKLLKCHQVCFLDTWGGNQDSAVLLVVSISRTPYFLVKNAQKWPFLGLLSPPGPKGPNSEKSEKCSNIVSNRLLSIQGGFQ